MTRFLPVALALAPAAAAWAMAGSDRFGLVLCLGMVSVAGGLSSLGRPLPRFVRLGAAAVALLTLPATTAIVMSHVPPRIVPFAIPANVKQLADLALPAASEASFDPRRGHRFVVQGNRLGELMWRGEVKALAEYGELAAQNREIPPLLMVDKDWPYLHWAWLLDLAREAGHKSVMIAAVKYVRGNLTPAEVALLGASLGHPDWPDCELELPLDTSPAGETLRIDGTEKAAARWGHDAEIRILQPTNVRYHLGGRETSEIGEVGRWIRDGSVGVLEPRANTPLKFVVAVLNEYAKAGLPYPALVTPRPPTERELQYMLMPFPEEE